MQNKNRKKKEENAHSFIGNYFKEQRQLFNKLKINKTKTITLICNPVCMYAIRISKGKKIKLVSFIVGIMHIAQGTN